MKIRTLGVKNNDVYGSFKQAVISSLIGYGKMYELLHKQLFRKNRISYAGNPFMLNGKEVRVINHWNIKSHSQEAYDRDDVNNLGLNQLFAEQSPYANYEGDPKDGIYHDDCYIKTKQKSLTCINRMGWVIDGNGHWIEKDIWNKAETISVTSYEKFHEETINTVPTQISDGWFYSVETPTQKTEYPLKKVWVDLGDERSEYQNPNEKYIDFSNPNASGEVYEKSMEIPTLSDHGKIVELLEGTPTIRPDNLDWRIRTSSVKSKIIIYEDGTAYEYYQATKWNTHLEGEEVTRIQDGGYYILPLIYTATGDLVQNRIDFVDEWDKQFELYVHEDSYWYIAVIKIVIILISMIIAVISGFSAVGVMGAAISGIGAVGGNKVLSVIGTVMTLGVSIDMIGREGIKQAGQQAGFSGLMSSQVASNATYQQVFSSFISNAGLFNLVAAGSSVFSLATTILTPELSQKENQEVQEDKGMSVYAYSDEDDDVMSLENI